MELNHLWEFTVVAEMLNFSLAADFLYTTQSTLSKHIASMEKELNVKLFQRNTRSVTLTKAGEQLLPVAKQISESYNGFRQQLYQQEETRKASVSILAIPVLAQYDIINTIYSFQKLHPAIELKVDEQESLNIPSLLEQPDNEFAIMRFFGEIPEQYDYLELCKDSFVAVLPSNHMLTVLDPIPLSKLKKETFILLDKDTRIDLACKDLFQAMGFTPKVRYQGRRPENIIGFVSIGMGISLLMRRHAEFFKTPQVTIRNVTPTTESRVCLIWKKNRALSPAAVAFLHFLQTNPPNAQEVS